MRPWCCVSVLVRASFSPNRPGFLYWGCNLSDKSGSLIRFDFVQGLSRFNIPSHPHPLPPFPGGDRHTCLQNISSSTSLYQGGFCLSGRSTNTLISRCWLSSVTSTEENKHERVLFHDNSTSPTFALMWWGCRSVTAKWKKSEEHLKEHFDVRRRWKRTFSPHILSDAMCHNPAAAPTEPFYVCL